jgi:hypothetical protein
MPRTYLIVGGDEYERGVVAGNVALAAHTTYKVVRPFGSLAGGHLCLAVDALTRALDAEPARGAVLLVEDADPLFGAAAERAYCSRCVSVDLHELPKLMRERGGTYLFAVGPSSVSGGPTAWRPDVEVYLTHAEPSSLVKALSGHPRVRTGSARPA